MGGCRTLQCRVRRGGVGGEVGELLVIRVGTRNFVVFATKLLSYRASSGIGANGVDRRVFAPATVKGVWEGDLCQRGVMGQQGTTPI